MDEVTSAEAVSDATVWHGVRAEEACAQLGVDPARGLEAGEVERRREQVGPNKLEEAKKEPGWQAFLRQYRDLMQLVLLGAAVVSMVRAFANRRFVQLIGLALALSFLVTELHPLQRIFDT